MAATSNSGGSQAHGDKAATFEDSYARLQEVVAKLSEGNLTLQDALNAYEEGMSLAARCAGMLDEAELRVKQVSEKAMRAGSAALADLDDEMRAGARNGDTELVAIEIESFETTLVFEEVPTRKPAPRPTPTLKPLPDDLDPLFDDE